MTEFSASSVVLRNTQLIEASAGTGKTYTITNLCLRLLLGRDENWQRPLSISEILILTFTIAATDELKHRVATRIRQAREAFRTGVGDPFLMSLVADSTDLNRDLKLLTAAGQLMDEASIFTIHGFCACVLGEQAFESGAMFNQELNAERDHLLKTAAEDCFRRNIMTLDGPARLLAQSIWPNPAALARAVGPLIFRGDLNIHPAYSPSTTFDSTVAKAEQVKTLWLRDDLSALLESAGFGKNTKPYKQLALMEEACQNKDTDLSSELWQVYRPHTVTKALKKGINLPEHPVFELIEQISDSYATLKTNLWHEVLQEIRELIVRQKEDNHKLTLDDLLTSLSSAVRQSTSLATTIAGRWPVAMIDEFQDTDNTQNQIFSTVYQSGSETIDCSLLMIGDPKQAIYNFRGADIFTYINAKRTASGIHNLQTNWRSSPSLVEATNHLFNLPDIFGNDQDIPFSPVTTPPEHASMRFTMEGKTCAPFQLFYVGEDDALINTTDSRSRVMDYAAEATVSLINKGSTAQVEDAPINAGQIAILVRSRLDAIAAQQALSTRGVKSVYLTLESVFLQETAVDLKLILEAIIEPGNDHAIKAALASKLMQVNAEDINALNHDIQLQQQVLSEFREYHDLWLDQDIAPMLNALIERRRLAEKWLGAPDGERILTNLRHLIEVLQTQSTATPGMHQLLKWFSHEQREADTVSNEELQLRLESDENLVKIVTMHAAKGLEYDIVMIPMPLFTVFGSVGKPALFHEERDESFEAALELGGNAEHRATSTSEDEAEQMRLLYVAITRARYRCYLGLPKESRLNKSAFRQLLQIPEVTKTDDVMNHARQSLPESLFEIVNGNPSIQTTFQTSVPPRILNRPDSRPAIHDRWRIHSYTNVVSRAVGNAAPHVVSGFSDDDTNDRNELLSEQFNRHTFPRGSRIGVALHSLLEDVDFTDSEHHNQLCLRTINRLALSIEWHEVLQNWLVDILNSPLSDFRLNQISRSDRLDEMEFHFPLASNDGLSDYLEESGLLPLDGFKVKLDGMMTGLIDVLFRVNGKYFIADYKSNYLGYSGTDYTDAQLEQAIDSHHYQLQYMIYTVAVHRMLKAKQPDYDYNKHFGGVFYLFLRGMNGSDQSGIYQDKPDLQLIEQLDTLLCGQQ